GHDITVDLSGPQKLKTGQQATFYASGWIFGDSLAVQATDYSPVEAAHVTMAAIAGDPVANLANHDAKSRFDGAQVVVSGQVVSVNLPAGQAPAALLAGGVAPTQRLSAHDPLWRDAVTQAHPAHKGSHGAIATSKETQCLPRKRVPNVGAGPHPSVARRRGPWRPARCS